MRTSNRPQSTRRDSGGYPMAFTTEVDEDGVVSPCSNDYEKVRQCYRRRWCGVCGEPLLPEDQIAFIGSNEEVDTRWFHDAAMHLSCATFAFNACPFLSQAGHAGAMLGRPRPEYMVRYVTGGYKVPWWRRITNRFGKPWVKADPPVWVERWADRTGPV